MSTSPSKEDKNNQPTLPSNKRLQQTQAQVNEVVDIMRINVDKVLERDKNLSKLDNRADALQAGASQFEASAGKLKRKFWWRNCKMLMVLGTLITILAIVLIVWVVSSQKREARLQQLEEERRNHTLLMEDSSDNNFLDNISKSGGKPGKESVPEFSPNHTEEPLSSNESDLKLTPSDKNNTFGLNETETTTDKNVSSGGLNATVTNSDD